MQSLKGQNLIFIFGQMHQRKSESIYRTLTGKSILLPKWAYEYSAGGSIGFWNSGKGVYGNSVDAINGYKKWNFQI